MLVRIMLADKIVCRHEQTVTQSENEITAPIGTHHTKLDVYLTPSALHLKNLV